MARRRSLGFAWLGPVERARVENAWLDDVAASTNGAMVELNTDGVVTSIRKINSAGVPQVEVLAGGVLEQLSVGEVPSSKFTGADAGDGGSVERADRQHVQVSIAPDGQGRQTFEMVRVAVRDEHGVIIGARVMIDAVAFADAHPDAHALAQAFAAACEEPDPPVARLVHDDGGIMVELDGDVEAVLGVDPASALGRRINDLAGLVVDSDGSGSLEDLGQAGWVSRHARTFRSRNGAGWRIHSFSEPNGEQTTVWAVRVSG